MAESDLDYAKVTGRLGATFGDGDDTGDNPDIVWCDEGTVRITPLITYTKVAGAVVPWSAGMGVINATINSEGYLTYRGKPFVMVVDLTSDKVNPKIGANKATHRLEFMGVKAGGVAIQFPGSTVRFTMAGTDGLGRNDITDLMEVLPGAAEPIYRGPAGEPGPPGPGAANEDVAGYVSEDGPTKTALAATFVPHQDTAPDPVVSKVWADTSTEPPKIKSWDGSAWVETGGYAPPVDGIPRSDLDSAVQTALDKADASTAVSVDGVPVESYDLDTTPPTPGDLGVYTKTEVDDAIADAFAAVPPGGFVPVQDVGAEHTFTVAYSEIAGLMVPITVTSTDDVFQVDLYLDLAAYAANSGLLVIVLEVADVSNPVTYPVRLPTNGERLIIPCRWVLTGMTPGVKNLTVAGYGTGTTTTWSYQSGSGTTLTVERKR